MEPVFEKCYTIAAGCVDAAGICRPDALLQLLQDVAGEHAERIGTGREVMLSNHNCVWMLVRTWYQLDKPLMLGQTVRLRTWPSKNDATASERYFDMKVDGEPVGQALQMWVLVDIDQRRIARIRNFPEIQAMPLTEKPISLRLRHLVSPELHDAGFYTVSDEDMDINGHMNNARYLRCAMQPLGDGFVSQLQINYERECRAGQTLCLQTATWNGSDFVHGCFSDGSISFEAQIWKK